MSPTTSRIAMVRAALVGLGVGVAWGVAARVFMRLVATNPEFSWVGTGFILGVAGVWGAAVAIVAEARRQGRRRWWYLAALPGLLLFAGQGMPFVPALIVGSVALARWRRLGWVVAAIAATAPAVLIWWTGRVDPETMLSAPVTQQFWTLVGIPVLGLWIANHSSRLWRPRNRAVSASSAAAPVAPAGVRVADGVLRH